MNLTSALAALRTANSPYCDSWSMLSLVDFTLSECRPEPGEAPADEVVAALFRDETRTRQAAELGDLLTADPAAYRIRELVVELGLAATSPEALAARESLADAFVHFLPIEVRPLRVIALLDAIDAQETAS